MQCIIRDDDTCALTRVEELEASYGQILGTIPICLSVTPFRIPGPIPNYNEDSRYEPVALDTNKELVQYLRENHQNGNFDFAMHGYHHVWSTNSPTGPLFPDNKSNNRPWWREYLYSDDLHKKTKHGKEYLNELLNCNIITFVPPGNSISKIGLSAVSNNGMNLIGVPDISIFLNNKRPFSPFNQINAFRRSIWKLLNGRRGKFPFVLDFGYHKEIDYFLLYPSTDLETLKKDIDFVHSVNGKLILSTHYHAFDKQISSGETIGDALKEILDHINSKSDVKFVTYSELWDNIL